MPPPSTQPNKNKSAPFLLRALREFAYGTGLFFVSTIIGNVFYRLLCDIVPAHSMDRSDNAAIGASILFALAVLAVHIVRRFLQRRKLAQRQEP